MASYKVPQDVEADDKLLGPFSFRQFIYLIIVAMAIGMGYLLYQIFVGLVIIPIPIILFFGALALPLRKDQPMEAYMGALISFYFLKPRKRFWVPDGLNELVEITAPKQVEPDRVKDISGYEARARLGYLTDIVESDGWAVRGAGVATQGVSSMNTELYQEARSTRDIMDEDSGTAQKFDRLIEQRSQEKRQDLVNNFQQQASAQAPSQPVSTPQPTNLIPPVEGPYQSSSPAATATPSTAPLATTEPDPKLQFNPYPNSIKQSVVQPVSSQQSTSVKPPSPDIIRLANDSEGLTVASVAKQAHRLDSKSAGLPEEEVEISLR